MAETERAVLSVPESVSSRTFSIGFHVRIPIEVRDDNDSREYRIGRIVSLPDEFDDIEVELRNEAIGGLILIEVKRLPRSRVQRCRIQPNAPVTRRSTQQTGRLLAPVEDSIPSGAPLTYVLLVDGRIQQADETDLEVGSTYQDPYPVDQLVRYEFHHPTWKLSRDALVQTVAELGNATYGLDQLVAARIDLLPHQAETVARVLTSADCRFVLADEVGLGKTIEAALIAKGMRRRHPELRILIVAPASLVHQWQRELDDRFWLRFPLMDDAGISSGADTGRLDRRGIVVSEERFASDAELRADLASREWGLLIIDEAHHVRKNPRLHRELSEFSRRATGVLVLTATPIQRRKNEFLSLLQLLDPDRYGPIAGEEFDRLLGLQSEIIRAVSYLSRSIEEELFDTDEFLRELQVLRERLADDAVLARLINEVQSSGDGRRAEQVASEALAYLSENYRLESRIIRNRRAHLETAIPGRELVDSYAYSPGPAERSTLDGLWRYLEHVRDVKSKAVGAEFARIFVHAATSSAPALLAMVNHRLDAIESSSRISAKDLLGLIEPAGPRAEAERIRSFIAAYPRISGEERILSQVRYLTERWWDGERAELHTCLSRSAGRRYPQSSRLGRALEALHVTLDSDRASKVLLFASCPETIDALADLLPRAMARSGFAIFRAGMSDGELQTAADRFQATPDCRVLLSDQLGGEGRNFQMARAIIHVDLPWTPAELEQRIGRVDRIGRSGVVTSIVPYARDTPDEQLMRLWNEALQFFTRSMSGMEIALEDMQNDLTAELYESPRNGLSRLLRKMTRRAEELRELVEEERYFDQRSVDRRLRSDFEMVAERYRDGKVLRQAICDWSSMAGLRTDYSPEADTVTYNPARFREASMTNAKVVALPNMEDALRRSRRRNNLEVRGTFNRGSAVAREDLVFFAPGSDPWIDAIVTNSLGADRGRSCAIMVKDAPVDWNGLDFLFSLSIDPRPIFRLGFDPTKLFEAQGYLRVPTHRVLISFDGAIADANHPIRSVINLGWRDRKTFVHLGERSGKRSNLDVFREQLPPEQWRPLVRRLETKAWTNLQSEFSFLADEAAAAAQDFADRVRGRRAAYRWFHPDAADDPSIASYEQLTAALVEGIKRPKVRLESVGCWILRQSRSGS